MQIGNEITLLRTKNGIKRAELADELKVSHSLVGLWETGKRLPSLDMLISIADYFHVSIDYLLRHDRKVSPAQFTKTAETDESIQLLLDTYNKLNKGNKYILLGKAMELLKEESVNEATYVDEKKA